MPNPIPKEHINYILTHVILPPKLPSEDDSNNACDFAFCQILTSAVESFKSHATAAEKDVWTRVEGLTRHLGDLTEATTRERIRRALTMAQPGDLRAVYMRSQNACMLFTRQEAETLVTAWEASPRAKDVLKPTGKLICSYPGPAVAIPNSELDDAVARDELSSVLAQLALYDTSAIPMTHKAGSSVPEEREAADPAYITNFVMAVLRGKGRAADVQRFSKRVADDSIAASSTKPWRRSPLWLSIRVAMQASLPEAQYKAFMIYFHAYLVDIAVNMKYGSEVLYFGQAKMARRLHKLPQAPAFVGAAVTQVVDRAQGLLGTRWKAIRLEQEKSAPWDPATLDLPAATHQPLTNSREYLLQALNGNNERPAAVEFNPKERPRMRDIDELSEFIEHAAFKGAEPRLALMDFERAIRNNIDAWTDRNLYDKQAAIVVGECMVQYLDLALVQYKDSAEDQSYMILTAMELWVALDKIVLEQYPLMKEYLPVIPSSFLQPTLLRHTETIHRANEIQKYLRVREMQAQAQDHLQSIFSPDAVNDTSFSVRYYDEAEALQQLHREIQRKARDERMIKRDELSTLNGKHASLRRTADKMRHEYTEERVHKAACPRCALETRINDMKIDMHEWPLPEDENAAKNVVFELNVPFPSAMWRSCTYRVLVDIGSTQPRGYSGTSYRLDKYEPLTHWSSKWFPDRRVTVASSQASFSHSHFSRVSIPATETSVLVNCTLHLRLFDSECHSLASGPFITDILDRCTLKLPKTGPYATLDFAVRGTTHTPNQVIAMQGDCPDGLSPFEHHTYCMVRCGARLQTLKVIEQITSQGLTWGREEVNTLLAQTMWQLGWLSQDGALREWHQDLENKKIALRLLETSMERLKSIESNWLEAVTVRSLVTIVARLLASTVDGTSEVARQAYIFMRKARDVTYQWMHNLADELQSVMDQQRLSEFQSRLCDVAATCRATYDVDDKHLASLFSSRGDVAQFLECSATLNDNAPPLANKVDQALKAVLNRDRRLAHYLERTLERKLNNDWGSPILKQAITAVWPGYRPRSSSWEALPVPNSRWVTARTRHDAADGAQQIHFNLLDGRLLVNGKPLGRLPKDIVVHPLYVRIFGKKILNVIHSEMLGMEFCTRTEISGYRVHFYLNMARKDLIIRAQRGAQVLQIIPHNILENDFPAFFTRGQTHWLDLESKRMEFRPMASLWKTSPSNWTLHFSHTHSSYMVQGASPTKLVDVRSPVASMIHGRISPFEKPIYTNITYDSSSSLLLANLPRSRLAFSLNNAGDLESRNLPGMVIDNN
ncbi:hypothetical protein OF83DRAFT_346661 [Amylostereum chailletii]|nr:hypothetical protein OF83DRAFT_346661 [Amylostereum chailletii]